MPDMNHQNGMFNLKPKRKSINDVNFPPLTTIFPDLVRDEIPRPERMPESVSILHLANYIVNYPTVFSPDVIEMVRDPEQMVKLNQRLKTIVTQCYNGSALTKHDKNLNIYMADELAVDGGGYEFFLKFAGNWFARKLLQCRYKTFRYAHDRAARGIPRSVQSQKRHEHQFKTKGPVLDMNKHTNPGGRAASQRTCHTGRPKGIASLWFCAGCVLYRDPKDWSSPRLEACSRHQNSSTDGSHIPLPRHQHIHSLGNRSRTNGTRQTSVPTYDLRSDEYDEYDDSSFNEMCVDVDMNDLESDIESVDAGRQSLMMPPSVGGTSQSRHSETLGIEFVSNADEDGSLFNDGEESDEDYELIQNDSIAHDSGSYHDQDQFNHDKETELSPGEKARSLEQQMIRKIRLLEEQVATLKASRQRISQRHSTPVSSPRSRRLQESLPKKSTKQFKSTGKGLISRQLTKSPSPPLLRRMTRSRKTASRLAIETDATSGTRVRQAASQPLTTTTTKSINGERRTRGRKPLSDTNSIPLPSGRS